MTEQNLASIAVKIDQDTINKTVERIVLQEIASKLGDPGAYFDRVIKAAYSEQVDKEGNPTKNNYYAVGTLIDFLAFKVVKEFTNSVVNDWMSDNKDKLRAAIEKGLAKNVPSMAKILSDAAARSTSWSERFNITIVPPKAG